MSTRRDQAKIERMTKLAQEQAAWHASWPERFVRIMYDLTARPVEQGVSIDYEFRYVTAEGAIHIKVGRDEWADEMILGPDSPREKIDQIDMVIRAAVVAKNERERIARIAAEAKASLTDEQLAALGLHR